MPAANSADLKLLSTGLTLIAIGTVAPGALALLGTLMAAGLLNLEIPEGSAGFNSAAMAGGLALLFGIATPLMAFLGPVALIGGIGCLAMSIIAFARYAQTIINLARHARRLAQNFVPEAPVETGFSRFNG